MAPSRSSPQSPEAKTNKIIPKQQNAESSLWKLKVIRGKGKGLVANKDIAPGTLLISEKPLITTDVVTSLDMDITEKDLEGALKKLSLESQETYRGLHNNYEGDGKHPLSGIVRSNAYPLGADAEVGGVFPNISRINHSCRPNTVQYWNPLSEQETVYAVRSILEGEEITLSYHAGGPSKERKEILKEYFGFDCTCEICSMPEEELKASDERLTRAVALDKTIGDPSNAYHKPMENLHSCRSLLKLYEVEGIKDGRLSRLYYDAFQVCNMHGDLARARCFAKYYVDSKKISEGPDSLNVLEMKTFVKSPQKHGSWGSTDKWKTETTDVPRGLNSREFAKWLWREGS